MTRKTGLILAALLLALAENSSAQRSANWRVFRVSDGLAASPTVAVTAGQHGKILANHLTVKSVSELDGYGANVIPTPPSGAKIFASPAGQLWSVTATGLAEFKDGEWLNHPVPEIAEALRAGLSARSISLCPVRQGLVIFLLPDRLLQLDVELRNRANVEVLRKAEQTGLEKFSGLTIARDGGLWISGARGVAKISGPARSLTPESEWVEFFPPATLAVRNFQQPFEDSRGRIVMLADSAQGPEKFLASFDGQRWSAMAVGGENIRHAWLGADETIWAMSNDALFESDGGRTNFIEHSGISARQYHDVAIEPGGTFWLATSDGLFRYAPPLWQTPLSLRAVTAPVENFAEDAAGRFWFVAGNNLHCVDGETHRSFAIPHASEKSTEAVRTIFPMKDGTLIFQTEELIQFRPDDEKFSVLAMKHGYKRFGLGLLPDGNLCVRTTSSNTATGDAYLEIFDGAEFREFPFPSLDAEFVTRCHTLFSARNGDVWLGGESGVAWLHDRKWQIFSADDKTLPADARVFAEMPDGRIWCATRERIWEFDGKNWLAVRSGFDHINALLPARDGSAWVASNNGLHRWYQGAWIENNVEDGLPNGSVRDVFVDRRGRVWAGTASGLARHHPEADPDAPQSSFQQRSERENTVPEGGTITLAFGGMDKWKYTPRYRLLYSYRLDEREWSPFQDLNAVSFTDLPAGKHYFQVRAMDRNGNIDPRPARLEFAVTLPWFKERRLVYIAFAGMIVALFFAALAFNRHRRLLHSYAEIEQKVAERTQELERASRELLHSQKMNALGTLAAGLAHDFNNILSIVKGSAQIIEDNLNDAQKIRTRVDRIKMVADQGAGVVKALLGFSRDSAQQPAVCEINTVVEDTIKLLGDRFLRDVKIQFEPGENLPAVHATRDFIQQILLNFIFNAAESMTENKRVILTTRALTELPGNTVLAPARAPAYVLVAVQDFGCGISPENLPRIFEPFFTTKALSVRRGTGLGLSMVYELAKKMEAGLAVESVVNEGTVVTLILPVRTERAATADA